jgi:hypothetical protein
MVLKTWLCNYFLTYSPTTHTHTSCLPWHLLHNRACVSGLHQQLLPQCRNPWGWQKREDWRGSRVEGGEGPEAGEGLCPWPELGDLEEKWACGTR